MIRPFHLTRTNEDCLPHIPGARSYPTPAESPCQLQGYRRGGHRIARYDLGKVSSGSMPLSFLRPGHRDEEKDCLVNVAEELLGLARRRLNQVARPVNDMKQVMAIWRP